MGRPLKFGSKKVLQKRIDGYFSRTPMVEWTITGLALELDTSRETLANYEEREEFFDTIKKAKTKVEHAYELSLRANGRTGDIFALKNFGWQDKTEQETKVSGALAIAHLFAEANESRRHTDVSGSSEESDLLREAGVGTDTPALKEGETRGSKASDSKERLEGISE